MSPFSLLWFDSLMKRTKVEFFSATSHWYIGWWNSYFCRLHMCGICECNTLTFSWRVVFLASIFWKSYSLKGITAEPRYIENNNTTTHFIRSFDESSKQAAFDVLFSGIVWTHNTFQVHYHQGQSVCNFKLAGCLNSSQQHQRCVVLPVQRFRLSLAPLKLVV